MVGRSDGSAENGGKTFAGQMYAGLAWQRWKMLRVSLYQRRRSVALHSWQRPAILVEAIKHRVR